MIAFALSHVVILYRFRPSSIVSAQVPSKYHRSSMPPAEIEVMFTNRWYHGYLS